MRFEDAATLELAQINDSPHQPGKRGHENRKEPIGLPHRANAKSGPIGSAFRVWFLRVTRRWRISKAVTRASPAAFVLNQNIA